MWHKSIPMYTAKKSSSGILESPRLTAPPVDYPSLLTAFFLLKTMQGYQAFICYVIYSPGRDKAKCLLPIWSKNCMAIPLRVIFRYFDTLNFACDEEGKKNKHVHIQEKTFQKLGVKKICCVYECFENRQDKSFWGKGPYSSAPDVSSQWAAVGRENDQVAHCTPLSLVITLPYSVFLFFSWDLLPPQQDQFHKYHLG